MNKYKTANGTIATEQELRSYYGVRFEEMLASGAFIKVEEGAELKKKSRSSSSSGSTTRATNKHKPTTKSLYGISFGRYFFGVAIFRD